MFDYSKMIKRAIEFFPQWSDIRKRHQTSIGGRLMSSILDESVKIEEAIEEYIDSYFLYNYIGHEDEVMAFIYTANIGLIDDFDDILFFYNDKQYFLKSDIKEFEKESDSLFYEEGKIYLKVEDYLDIDTIIVQIDEMSTEYKLKKVHVWNIFDEFATFVNTRRYENETNKELLNRILYITENLPNGTEEGLKHAIVSELLTDCPDITINDIKIEGPTPENLIKAYEDYETLLDLLAEVNRDVYRTKRWDIDYWQYNFESIEYLPHVWDKVVDVWQNGVGSYKDLEVVLSDNSMETDATIYFYKKTLEAFQKYVYDKYIDNNIHFTLTKYNNILNKTKVLYKIEASELRDISYDEIYMQLYESETKTEDILIEDIATDWGRNIEKIENNILDENNRNSYKLRFKSKTGYDLKIAQAVVLYTNKDTGDIISITDLLDDIETPGFVLNSEYELVSSATKMILNNVAHFTTSEGLKNNQGNITLDDGYSEAEATLSLTNKAGLYVNYIYDCKTVRIPDYLITCIGGYWDNDDNFVVRGDYSIEDKVLKINIVANYLSFRISDENINARITMEYDDEVFGKQTIELGDQIRFETKKTDIPRKISLTMNIISIQDVKFSNFQYSNYSITLDTKHGSLTKTDKGYKLGNFYNNELILKMSALTGCSPYIKGIYIGEDFKDIAFNTRAIPNMDNCVRVFQIKTNGIIDLIKIDDNGFETGDVVEDYRPYTQYKAIDDNAYIRVDLSEYSDIEDIPSDTIVLERIEESGKTYYNIRLKNKQIVDTITIKGTRMVQARIVTLRDLIKFYVKDFDPTYDKIYCSKSSKGLILGRQNPGGTPYNMLVNIKSEVFTGLDIVKYTMVMPEDLGSIYGSNNGYENRSYSTMHSFDYISIYPEGAQIYQAINEYTTCVEYNRNIPITNNFSPSLDTSKLLFYRVEVFNEDEIKDYVVVRFHGYDNADTDIYDLPTWSIGTTNSYIAIQNNVDMLNNLSYNMTTYNIDDTVILSSTADIKDTYSLTDNTVLNTEKFIVKTDNDNISIKYDYYDGTEKKAYLLKHEEVIVEADGFNKLTYSNIDTIYHISTSPFEGQYVDEITEYNILKDEGIIIWKDHELISNNTKIYLVYSIKKPVAFVFDIDYLYKAIDFDVEAYSFMKEYKMSDKNNNLLFESGDKVYLTNYNEFKDSDLVYVSCDNPTFEAQLENDIIIFNKYTEEPTLLIKTGYYYINGREYYLFSEKNSEEIKNNALYSSSNIDISGGEIITYKPTNNYLNNSEMRLKGVAELYNFDCKKPLTYGISKLNSLTSCESFNNWNSFGMNMKLVDGLNGFGLYFTPEIENGYAYLDITDYLTDNVTNYISFYANKNLKVFLGKEEKYLNIDFNRALNIGIEQEIAFNNSDIRNVNIIKTKGYSYYLIVQLEGIIDDIVISTDPNTIYESHTKNISLLGFNLYEKRVEGSRYKMMLNSNLDYKPFGAGLMSDGSFKTTSNIDWHVTQIYSLDKDEDFKSCILTNIGIGPDYIYTTTRDGYLETQPIFLGDVDNIKQLIFKINDIDFINMKNFDIVVESCDRYNGTYVQCGTISRNNKFHVQSSYLKSYIKIKITMPANKYINNISIFAEYVSSNEDPLSIITKQSGYIESKIYDLQELTNCFVKSIDIIDISNINDVSIQIRSSRDSERLDVWSNWREIKLNDNLKVSNVINFADIRFLQFKIVLKTRKAFIKLKGINIEIK